MEAGSRFGLMVWASIGARLVATLNSLRVVFATSETWGRGPCRGWT